MYICIICFICTLTILVQAKKLKQEREDFTESDTECVGVKERGWM